MYDQLKVYKHKRHCEARSNLYTLQSGSANRGLLMLCLFYEY